jgi:hypothetical protein
MLRLSLLVQLKGHAQLFLLCGFHRMVPAGIETQTATAAAAKNGYW